MSDLISRQAAIDAVADLYWMDERLLNFKKEIDATFDKIKALPSAQPEPMPKRGEWIFHSIESPYRWECNKCGDKVRARYNFCPNCGAKMERSEEHENQFSSV